MKMNNKKRFTLIELIIVIVVIGILAGMALPKFTGVTKDARATALRNDADVLQTVAALIETENDGTKNPYGAKEDITKAEPMTLNGATYEVLPLNDTLYKSKLSKLPKTGKGDLTKFKVIVEGDEKGTIVYDETDDGDAQVGITDSEGKIWYGVDIYKPAPKTTTP